MYDKSDFGRTHSSVNASLTQNLDEDKEGFIKVNYNEINSIEKVYELFGIY